MKKCLGHFKFDFSFVEKTTKINYSEITLTFRAIIKIMKNSKD